VGATRIGGEKEMGYTHYWYRKKTIDEKTFKKIVSDFKQLLPWFRFNGIKLAGGLGNGNPTLNSEKVVCNGYSKGGHRPIDGKLYNNVDLNITKRACDGDCAHETFYFPRELDSHRYQTQINGVEMYFNACKTAFKPYDFAVNCFLIIAKHHLDDEIIVRSDGGRGEWIDAVNTVYMAFKYGDFKLNFVPIKPTVDYVELKA